MNQLKALGTLGYLLSAAFVIASICWPFQLLWNGCLVGAIDSIQSISYTRAVGIVLMFGLLLVGAIAMFSLFTVKNEDQSE